MGHVVSQVQVAPATVKFEAIFRFLVPANRRELMRLLGVVGYYCKFCHNFSTLTEPFMALLWKREMLSLSVTCQEAYDKIKPILFSEPVLMAPSFKNHSVCLWMEVTLVYSRCCLVARKCQENGSPYLLLFQKIQQSLV